MKYILKSLLLSFCVLAININANASSIGEATNLDEAIEALKKETSTIIDSETYKDVSQENKQKIQDKINSVIENAKNPTGTDDEKGQDPTSTTTSSSDTMTEEQKAEIAEKEAKVEELKEKEQSLANRMTTAVSMGGAGIGGMMLAESLSEQRVDAQSEQDMAAYIETFRCTYANGKSVKGGATNVELPADTLFDLYQEYIALAADVKTMKEQLDLMPGIESEVVMDKATMGLYDDKASDKINGTYASLYRVLTDESSEDAQQWADQKEKTDKNKKIGIGVGVGAAAVGGIGNILTNHVDWDKIKEKKNTSKANTDKIKQFKEGLKSAGMTNINKLDLSKFDFSDFDIESINFEDFKNKLTVTNRDSSKLNTANMTSFMSSLESIGLKIGQ